jgi:hypothetical protein
MRFRGRRAALRSLFHGRIRRSSVAPIQSRRARMDHTIRKKEKSILPSSKRSGSLTSSRTFPREPCSCGMHRRTDSLAMTVGIRCWSASWSWSPPPAPISFGVSIVSVKAKGQASKMLSILFDRPSREDHRSAESSLIGTSPRGSKCPLGQNPRR